MELKLTSNEVDTICEFLLIVPYGIETSQLRWELGLPCRLLIVPYGIETCPS